MPQYDRLAPAERPGRRPAVFLGGPFKALIDPATGTLPEAVRIRYAVLIAAFEAAGWEVLNAHRTEQWGATAVGDGECTRRDWDWMRRCEVFVAFPGAPASPGTHVELGWASALGRPALVLVEPGTVPAALVGGLPAIAPVQLIEYDGGAAAVREVVALVGRALAEHGSPAADPAAAVAS
jgi:hypothetical protein